MFNCTQCLRVQQSPYFTPVVAPGVGSFSKAVTASTEEACNAPMPSCRRPDWKTTPRGSHPRLFREPTKILLAWQINPHWRALRCTTCFSSRLPAGKSRGASSEGKRSRPEPFMHEKQAEEAPGQARLRWRMRSRNIPANSGPALWSFIVQRADEAYPLRRSPEQQAEVWASDRFQDRPGRRAGPARRSRGLRRCTFPRCRRACARKC